MSVEITTPHADAAAPDGLSSRYSSAGRTRPATAAASGTAAFDRSRSSPIANSRLTSSPMTKKKSAIRPSLTQCCRSRSMPASPTVIASWMSQNAS